MSHPIETTVGIVSRKNVITLTGGAPGPAACTPPQTHPERGSPSPTPRGGISLAGASVPGLGTAGLHHPCPGPGTGS